MSTLLDFSISRRDPVLPCNTIPFERNREFCDRFEVLEYMEEVLAQPTPNTGTGSPGDQSLKVFGLCGPGGMGKTQVAAQFAWLHVELFDAIFWIHAEERTKLASDFSHIAIDLGLLPAASQDAKDQVVTRELVKGWLAKPVRSYKRLDNTQEEEAKWLLIFDNVEDQEDLEDFWPLSGSTGSVLMTSRDPLAKTRLYKAHQGCDLQPFPLDDAASFLLTITWREGEDDERKVVREVAQKLGGLPLAITQMAGVMVRQQLSFRDFIQRYEEEKELSALFNLSVVPTARREPYGYTLASVWALESLEQGSSLLNVLSLLDGDGIQEEILKSSFSKITLSGYPSTITAYQNARFELSKSSLVSRDKASGKLMVHRVIQDAARARMDQYRLVETFRCAVRLVLQVWPAAGFGQRHNVGRWSECETLTPHMLRLHRLVTRLGIKDQLVLKADIEFASLLNELGW